MLIFIVIYFHDRLLALIIFWLPFCCISWCVQRLRFLDGHLLQNLGSQDQKLCNTIVTGNYAQMGKSLNKLNDTSSCTPLKLMEMVSLMIISGLYQCCNCGHRMMSQRGSLILLYSCYAINDYLSKANIFWQQFL